MSITTFEGYPTDLLLSIKHLGRAVVGDDALYEAAQAYTDPSKGGGIFGPALTASDCTVPVDRPTTSAPTSAVHDSPEPPKADADDDDARDEPITAPPTPLPDDTTPWDDVEWSVILHLLKAHEIPRPRTMGKATAIQLLMDHKVPVPA